MQQSKVEKLYTPINTEEMYYKLETPPSHGCEQKFMHSS